MYKRQVHFNDRIILSFGDKIDWDKCLLRLPLSAIGDSHKILPEWLATHSDAEIIERGQYARQVWQTWLAPNVWGCTTEVIIKEKLGL